MRPIRYNHGPHRLMCRRLWLFVSIFGALGTECFAQLFADNGGPPDVFFESPTNKGQLGQFYYGFDQSSKGVNLTYFQPPTPDDVVLGAKLSVSAQDGLTQLSDLTEWPKVQLQGLALWF